MIKKLKVPPLVISAKAKSWRLHDTEEKNAENTDFYQQIRPNILRRDNWTCQFCGFKTNPNKKADKKSLKYSGFLEVHHLDDDHSNNNPDNLITACPFCHSVFHCGFAGHSNQGSIVLMPYIKQKDISILFNLLSVINVKEESQFQEIYDEIKDFFLYCEGLAENILEDLSDPSKLASVLVNIEINDPKAYKQLNKVLWPLRLIPKVETKKFKDAAQYWNQQEIWLPEKQWKPIFYNFIKKTKMIKAKAKKGKGF